MNNETTEARNLIKNNLKDCCKLYDEIIKTEIPIDKINNEEFENNDLLVSFIMKWYNEAFSSLSSSQKLRGMNIFMELTEREAIKRIKEE